MAETKRSVVGGSKKKIVPGPYGGELGKPDLIRFPDKMAEAIVERGADTGENGDDLIRRYVTEGLLRDLEGNASEIVGEVSFSLDDKEYSDLTKLAKDLYVDLPNVCAKMIVSHALRYELAIMRDFVAGRLVTEVADSPPARRTEFRKDVEAESKKERAPKRNRPDNGGERARKAA